MSRQEQPVLLSAELSLHPQDKSLNNKKIKKMKFSFLVFCFIFDGQSWDMAKRCMEPSHGVFSGLSSSDLQEASLVW